MAPPDGRHARGLAVSRHLFCNIRASGYLGPGTVGGGEVIPGLRVPGWPVKDSRCSKTSITPARGPA